MTPQFGGVAVDVDALRPLLVVVPIAVAGGLWLAVNDIRRRGASALALLWNLIGLVAVNVLAQRLGWWAFDAVDAAIFGVPVDLLLTWAAAWSMIPVLAAQWIPLRYSVVALVVVDLYAMPTLAPVVVLGSGWWWGEAVAVGTCLLPAMALAHLTVRRRWLRVRVGLQVVLFAAVLFVALPAICAQLYSRSGVLTQSDAWTLRVTDSVDLVVAQIAGVVALVALAAVGEFARAGGTPWPWDPPTRIVTTGPYAYVANPMQLCGTLLVILTGVVLWLPLMFVAGLVTAAFSAGLAAYVEDDALSRRFGAGWSDYRSTVRVWLPRWRPALVGSPARVYLARGCDPCSELAAWIVQRSPIGLEILAAQDYPHSIASPGPLRRIRYCAATGTEVDGVRAVGAVLVHLNLAWAITGWVIATPVISHLLQVVVDACGGHPRDATPLPHPSPAE